MCLHMQISTSSKEERKTKEEYEVKVIRDLMLAEVKEKNDEKRFCENIFYQIGRNK